jgi:recombination protein RecT
MATAMTETKASNKQMTIKDHLASDAMKKQIAAALPKHCSPERMARVAITALMRIPKLAECDQKSFFQALMQLSSWGLEPDGRRAHLIPFRNNKLGITECQLIIDYKGLVELAYNSGQVSSIHADVVCENDDFEYDQGQITRHRIDLKKPRGKMYAVYAKVVLVNNVTKCEVLGKDEVDAIRARSRSGNNGPWVSDYNEMAKKTAFRRLTKWLPLSAEVREASYGDDDVPVTLEATVRKPAANLDDLADRLCIGSEDAIEASTDDEDDLAAEAARREALEASEGHQLGD